MLSQTWSYLSHRRLVTCGHECPLSASSVTTEYAFMSNNMFAKYLERKIWSKEFDEDLASVHAVPRPKEPPGKMDALLVRMSLRSV